MKGETTSGQVLLTAVVVCAAAWLPPLLGGCTAGSPVDGSSSDATVTGSVTVSVAWPEVGSAAVRMIPDNCQNLYLRLARQSDGCKLAEGYIVRPRDTIGWDKLPCGPAVLYVDANPRESTAAPLASCALQLAVKPYPISVPITLGSTIASLTITPSPAPVWLGASVVLGCEARDAKGRIVLTPEPAWSVVSGSEHVGLPSPPAGSTITVNALSVGDAVLQARVVQQTGPPEAGVFTCNVTVQVQEFEGPSGLRALPGDTKVALTWSHPAEGAPSAYVLYRGTAPDPTALLAELAGSSTSYADTSGLVNGTAYYYALRAKRSTGALSSAATAGPVTPYNAGGASVVIRDAKGTRER